MHRKGSWKEVLAYCLITIICSTSLFAQKGQPPKPVVTINHSTNYAQHEDFSPSMVKRLKTAPGWTVSAAATGLGKPRMLCFGPAGQLYVTRRDAGDVLMLNDTNGDQEFDQLQTIIAEFPGVHGIAIKDGWLYGVSNRELRRYRLNNDGTASTMELLINDLPDAGQHPNRTMHFGPDGLLYLSVGSTCNDCKESNKENATMLQIDPSTWKRTIYARGLRNTIGFDWHPQTGELWGVDNGSDAKGDGIPPEELNMITKDGDYGWPLVWGKQVPDETREDPPGTTKAAYAKMTKPSMMDFPAHAAPIDFIFLDTARSLPDDYRDDALVCWHGSWNKKKPDGFKVQRIKFENGKPVASEDFLTGFFDAGKRSRFGRPAGLAVSPGGAIYISDDANGVIYCMKKTN